MPTDTAVITASEPARISSPDKTGKYRFWLAFTALLLSILFGILGVGTFAAGQGLALEHTDPAQMQDTVFLFNLVGTLVLGFTAGCLWLAYKLRPSSS